MQLALLLANQMVPHQAPNQIYQVGLSEAEDSLLSVTDEHFDDFDDPINVSDTL